MVVGASVGLGVVVDGGSVGHGSGVPPPEVVISPPPPEVVFSPPPAVHPAASGQSQTSNVGLKCNPAGQSITCGTPLEHL